MNWIGQVYFYVFAALAVVGGVATIAARNPIRGVMGLLATIVALACLFLALSAQFLAAIQLIVYAGAIVVLFMFVIMLLGPGATAPSDTRGLTPRLIGGLLFGAGAITAMVLAVRGDAIPAVLVAPGEEFGGVDGVGRDMFSNWIVPFELSSALLMVAAIGAVAIAKGKVHPSGTSGIAAIDRALRNPPQPEIRTQGGLESSPERNLEARG